ncbi:DUF2180 family protein [Streptomyces sp. NPDC056002]|uniref:DUF2180 family protein n=1 Tax=Streptomyces sp. NPDC056002 TaxID=3345675 RepID=UPI0035DFD518
MNCYDCPESSPNPAVAVCVRCGAAVCRAHLHAGRALATEVIGTGRATHSTAQRHITCATCHTAEVS